MLTIMSDYILMHKKLIPAPSSTLHMYYQQNKQCSMNISISTELYTCSLKDVDSNHMITISHGRY